LLKLFSELTPEVKYELLGIGLITMGIISLISLLGFSTGSIGLLIAKFLHYAFGVGAFVIVLVLSVIGSQYIWTRKPIAYTIKFWGLTLFFIACLALYHHWAIPVDQEILPESLLQGGGLLGGFILFGLRKLFGFYGTLVLLLAVALCSIIMSTAWSLSQTLLAAKSKAGDSLTTARQALASTAENLSDWHHDDSPVAFYNQETEEIKPPIFSHLDSLRIDEPAPVNIDQSSEPLKSPQPEKIPVPPIFPDASAPYCLPPFSLLKKSLKVKSGKLSKEIIENAHILESTLDSFGVSAKIIQTCQGPAVTRYELEPAPGVKVSRIVNLADDIALKLAAPGVRIEAPIPGKAAIGIEVPNKIISSVPHRDVLETDNFQHASSKLSVALGKDIAGQTIIADLAKMPHLLIAGATGSGKSVCINTLITSILFKARPDEAKFILIDPKVVELSNYNGIPHLLTPVVTDPKKAAAALRWAVHEMERRYALFAGAGVRDIGRYNETAHDVRLPLIVIIIDELADLMMVAPVDVEDAVCRLAQMARAAGLHLVLATQRPSVDVITGIIKANIPSRISFSVSSQIDSRTILDMAGAEKLLGKGDMLYYPVGAAKPVRVQGSFISDDEVEELVNFVSAQAQPEYTEGVTKVEATPTKAAAETVQDELLQDAVRIVLENGQASASMLQRKFRIGYSRAARLIDTMEDMKIVGPTLGSKARDVIMTSDEVQEKYFSEN
jgi:S-DNA-T family DNA segregation ATPase FtsK/SpoIIIE